MDHPSTTVNVMPGSPVVGKQTSTTNATATIDFAADQPHIKLFRRRFAELGFCISIALAGFLAEYLITGFAIELYHITERLPDGLGDDVGVFWPATLLTLVQGALLLVCARVADMYGGYRPFIFGTAWLAIWSLVLGFAPNQIVVSVSRAMQGIGIAAFTPAVNNLLGHLYENHPERKSRVLGLYAGMAPLGFFMGFFVASALPDSDFASYSWIAAGLASIACFTVLIAIPSDSMISASNDLKFDWLGSLLVLAGLVLVSYGLAVEPHTADGFRDVKVLCTLLPGLALLGVAVWVEGWVVACPLFPRDFFAAKSVVPVSFACIAFYACYGVWLYYSTQFFRSPLKDGSKKPITGMQLALWYLPTAVGGFLLCLIGGHVLRVVRSQYVLIFSALAWVGAPLLLVFCPIDVEYWAFIMPSMLCATTGLDLTYLVSLSYLTGLRDQQHQGFAGAYCSMMINLGMSFSLPIAEIVASKADGTTAAAGTTLSHRGFQATFIFATALAGTGLAIVVLSVRIPHPAVPERESDPELGRRTISSSEATLVGTE